MKKVTTKQTTSKQSKAAAPRRYRITIELEERGVAIGVDDLVALAEEASVRMFEDTDLSVARIGVEWPGREPEYYVHQGREASVASSLGLSQKAVQQ